MNAVQLVRDYLDASNPAKLQPDRLPPLLADDFEINDTMMGINDGPGFVAQLREYAKRPSGPMQMAMRVEAVIGEGERVAALVELEMGEVTVSFAQWFRVVDGKIAGVRVIYDPRPFMAMAEAGG